MLELKQVTDKDYCYSDWKNSTLAQDMENMDYDDGVVVDLSISNHNRIMIPPQLPNLINQNLLLNNISITTSNSQHSLNARRVLRPRTEPRSYVETPDVLMNGNLEKPSINGNSLFYSSDSSEEEMPPLATIKELSPIELKQRERGLRRLREELRAEEMKLVLLKKLKQSQQLKENVAVIPSSLPASAIPPTGLPSGLSITPTTVKVPVSKAQQPPTAHMRNNITIHKPGQTSMTSLLRGPPPARSSLQQPQLSGTQLTSRAANLSVPQPPPRNSHNRSSSNFPPSVKDLSPSVTITPALPQQPKITSGIDNKGIGSKSVAQTSYMPTSDQDRLRDDGQTQAQRQAAAKLALRKQLEKTLLQIPPPKPPPPEMHFIPNPSNTEFIYLVGLEHVIDYLTKDIRPATQTIPFQCSQCDSDFTPVWKWEKSKPKGKDAKVICEQCVTSNIKKALKAEHTNRLKTAFVKALQQEQEIEQRLAQNGSFTTSSSPAPSPVTPEAIVPKAVTPQPTPRHAATPPAPPPQRTPPPSRSQQSNSQDKYAQSAAAMQAIHQQLLRSIQSGGPSGAHMLQFSPLFYPYQLAMAQAAGNKSNTPNLVDLQRAADLQRQYLLDMIPPQAGQRHNWKT